jgi:hypothetical protein
MGNLIVGLVIFSIIGYFFVFIMQTILDENLQKKFIKMGVLNYHTYNDFVKKIRRPNEITYDKRGWFIAEWTTKNHVFDNFNIILVFSNDGKFLFKHYENLSIGSTKITHI